MLRGRAISDGRDGATDRPEIGDFGRFQDYSAELLGCRPDDLQGSARLLADLQMNDFSLFALVTGLQEVNPYFWIPEQMELEDITFGDLYSFFRTMGPDHWAEAE